MHLPSITRRLNLRALACASLALAFTVACSDDPPPLPSTQSQSTAASTATAEPTPLPPDPHLAETLRTQGDFERAAVVYGAVVATSEGVAQQDARLAQAQLLARLGRDDEARAVLLASVAAAPAGTPPTTARFLLAGTLRRLGDDAGALDQYERYIAEGGAAATHARAERAKLLARLGRDGEADAAAQEILVDSGALDAGSFALAMGQAFEEQAVDARALAWYTIAAARQADPSTALARGADVRRRLGDPAWAADDLRVVAEFPASAAATDALDALDDAGVAVGDYARGYVDYRAFRNATARAAFTQAVAAGDSVAESTYYLAALDERSGDAVSAISRYAEAVAAGPEGALADDAMWWRARLLDAAGRADEAIAEYDGLVARYPASEWRTDAEFHRGLVLYRRGRFAEAAAGWALAAPAADDDAPLRARYWRGLALRRAGATAEADALLRELSAAAPDTFYGLRAQVVLGEHDSDEARAKLDAAPADWPAIFTAIAAATGIDPAVAPVRALADPRWAVAAELDAAGLRADATRLFLAIVRDHDGDAVELAQIAREFDHQGRTSLTARAAVFLRRSLPQGTAPPDELLRVAYPPAYAALANEAAAAAGISPALLLSLVRQESFYDPDAGSTAGALGLTQVIPATGEAIANALGVDPFSPTDLFRPALSLRFGANYLASQLRAFDGNPYYALAAYNGGPGTASNAIDLAGDDVDLFVEDLEFDETKLYVKLVMGNYARYRQLYEGLDAPSLPQ